MGEGGSIALVNGTPYDWSLTHQHSYQMSNWSFPATIKSGTVAHVYVEWKQGGTTNQGDDGAEANYTLNGTSHVFQVQARSHNNNMINPAFELKVYFLNISTENLPPQSNVSLGWSHNGSVTFVLTGDQTNFSSTGGPANWMERNMGKIGNRTLRQICLPGTHDAGMSTIGAHTAFANARNTKTHVNNIAGQLNLGSRYIDIRPVISGGKYFTGHYSGLDILNIKGWQGANGQSIQDVVDEVNAFTAAHKELVILNLSHAYNTDAGNENYPDFNQAQWDGLLKQLTGQAPGINGLQRLFSTDAADLTAIPLNQFIANQGAVIVIVQPISAPLTLGTYANKGFYVNSQFNVYNNSTGTPDVGKMTGDQLGKMAANAPNGYFILSWTLTQDSAQAALPTGTSILDLAGQAYPQLFVQLLPHCSAQCLPNVLYVDGLVDTNVMELAVAINNLY